MIIEDLRSEDIMEVRLFMINYHEESNFADMPRDNDLILQNIMNTFHTEYEQIHVTKEDGKIMGFSWTTVDHPIFSYVPYGNNLMLYVGKEYRGGSAALKLLKASRKYAKSMGAKKMQVGIISGINIERIKQWFVKLGFDEVGAQFITEL